MKTVGRIFKWLVIILIVGIIALIAYVQTSWEKEFTADYPAIKASTDSAIIARGESLAYGLAHCAVCHVPDEKLDNVLRGEKVPLSGGWEISIPPGTFRAPNITPDEETGIGKLTDEELARTLRHMVSHDNKVVLPFMPYANMSDADLQAIISFLRSQPAQYHKVPENEYSFLGKAVMAFGLIKPTGPTKTPPKTVPIEASVDYGKYLANSVGDCVGCHTERSMQTGEFLGEPFAGGGDVNEPGSTMQFTTPNLTPDQNTGIMANWTEEEFIARFRQGRVYEESPMPWELFSRVDEVELKALYRYLMSLDPVYNKIEVVKEKA